MKNPRARRGGGGGQASEFQVVQNQRGQLRSGRVRHG